MLIPHHPAFHHRLNFHLSRILTLLLTLLILVNLTSLTFANGNTTPVFLDAPTQFIAIADQNFDLIPLLHVIDPDENQTLTWSVSSNPLHGEITLITPTWATPGTDLYPILGNITYCANRGYVGPDSFTMNISDGYDSTNLNFTVDVYSDFDQWDGTRATSFAGGTGTQDDPYLIATGAQLAYLSDFASASAVNSAMPPGLKFLLIADIDLNFHEWTPIGVSPSVYTYPFSGNIQGEGHTIYNLTIGSAATPNTDLSFLGLIGYAYDTIIEDLTLENVSIYSGLSDIYIGGLVGYMDANFPGATSSSHIKRCSVSGTLNGLPGSMLGLISGAYVGDASECSTAGSILTSGATYSGGLFGYVEPQSTISNCYSTASIITEDVAGSTAGGLAGYVDNLSFPLPVFFNCYATGNVISKGIADTGILIGNYASSNPVLDTCYFNSNALLVNNGSTIAAKGLGVGVDTGIAKTLEEMKRFSFATTLNDASSVIWYDNVPIMPGMVPQNLGLPELRNVPDNLGSSPRLIYDSNGAFNTYTPYDTGSYPIGATIPLATNFFGLDKGDEYDFLNWNTKADGTGTSYAEFADYTVTAENTLYATWFDVDPLPEIIEVLYPGNGLYVARQDIVFYIRFDQEVTVTGTLNLLVNFGQGEFPIALSSSSGTNTLEFRYTIASGDVSTGPIQIGALSSPDGAQVTDASLNAADLTYHNIVYTETYVDGKTPEVTKLTLLGATPQQLIGGDMLQLEIDFSEPVFMGDFRTYLEFTLSDSTPLKVYYKSGNESSVILFEGMVDVINHNSVGLTLGQYLFSNDPIIDAAGNAVSNTLPGILIPDLSAVTIDTRAPFVLSITPPVANSFRIGENFDLSLNFSQPVFVTSGLLPPHILLSIDTPTGNITQIAWYIYGSGSSTLDFQLSLTEPMFDMNGIVMNQTLQLLDSFINDVSDRPTNIALPAVDLSMKSIDTIAPYVTSVTLSDLPEKTLFGVDDIMHFQIKLNEPTYLMNWNPGNDGYLHLYFNRADFDDKLNYVLVPYSEGGSGTDTWEFSYIVKAGDTCNGTALLDTRIFADRMTFYDDFENAFDGSFNNVVIDLSSAVVDGISPQVTSMVIPAPRDYAAGQKLDFVVQYDEVVQVVEKDRGTGDYTVAMKLYLESGVVYAPLVGYWNNTNSQIMNTPSDFLLFQYTISNTDYDTDGIELTNMLLVIAEPYLYEGTHTLEDLAGNSASISLPNADTSGIIVLEPMPAPREILTTMQENVYALGQTLDISVVYDQPVFLTGSLDMSIMIGNTGKLASCTSGSGTNTLHFSYTIQANDSGLIGVASTLILNAGGSLTNATLAAAILELNNIRVINVSADAVAPSMYEVEITPNTGRFTTGQSIMFNVAFNEPCDLDLSLGEPQLRFNIGGQARIADYDADHGDGTFGYVAFRYDIVPGDYGALTLPLAITHNGAVLSDDYGNVAAAGVWTLINPDDLSALFIDTLPPEITSVTLLESEPQYYKQGDALTFRVVFDEPVTVYNTSTPMLELTLQDNSKAYAAYSSGSGTNTFIFECFYSLPNKYSDGILLSTTMVLGVAPPTDAVGNNFSGSISFPVMPDLSAVIIDTQPPTIVAVITPVQTQFKSGQALNLQLQFSELVMVEQGNTPAHLVLQIDTPFGFSTETAYYVRGSGSNTLNFTLNLPDGLMDLDGLDLNSNLQLLDTEVRDMVGNLAETLLPVETLDFCQVDTINPYITEVTLTELPGKTTFGIGDAMHFQVKLNEPTHLNNQFPGNDGYLHIYLDELNYVLALVSEGGSGTDTWEFTYTVQGGDVSNNTLSIDGQIHAMGMDFYDDFGNTFDGSFEAEVVEDLSDVVIDGLYAQAVNLIVPATNNYTPGQTLNFIVEYDEIVRSVAKIGGEGDYALALKLYLDAGVVYAPFVANWNLVTAQTTQAFTNFLLFRYTIANTDRDADGIDLRPMVFGMTEPYLHEGTHEVVDLAGNAASISLPNANTSGIKIVAPPVVEEPVVVPPTPVDTSPDEVIVNGEPNPIATMSREGENQNQQVLQIDGDEARNLLEQTPRNILFTLPFEETSDQYAGSLNGETVKLMEERKTVLQIQTPMATYTLPAHQLNIDKVARELGSTADLKDIEVRIEVSEPSAEDVQFVQDELRNNKITIVVQPMEFTITCSLGDQTVEVERFNGYVERLIAIPEGVDPNDISTAVVMHKNGKMGHVPTTIVLIDGKYYAKINSLTNSIYTLVQNAVEYTDTATHWAKAAIDDMSNRFIVEGVLTGKYMPEQQVNRAEFVTMLVKALGLEASVGASATFSDVALQDSFAGAIATAYEYGLVVGDGFGKFNPYDIVTREQVMTLLTRAMELAGNTVTVGETEMGQVLGSFTDAATVHDYAKEAVAYCVQAGILVGRTATTLAPTAMITRAEAAALLQRTLQFCELID
jgi:hypothetical protein